MIYPMYYTLTMLLSRTRKIKGQTTQKDESGNTAVVLLYFLFFFYKQLILTTISSSYIFEKARTHILYRGLK